MDDMDAIKTRLRTSRKWGFLAEMLGETDLPMPMAGVTYQGVLLVNPKLAAELSTADLVKQVRNEFKVAAELRKGVHGFK
jgi:hypothetical protein